MRQILSLTRPFVLIHTAIISLMYCIIAKYDPTTTILIILSMIAIHASAQSTNLIHDIDIDKINKPWRPLVSGKIDKYKAIMFDLAWITLAFMTAYLVNIKYFLWMIILAFFAWSFSLLPVRKNQFIHVFWMGMTRGFIPAYMITNNLPIALLMFMWNFAFNPSKDYKDIDGDLKFGIKTIVNQYGKEGLKIWMMIWGSTFYIMLLLFVSIKVLPEKTLMILYTLPLLFIIPETNEKKPIFSDNNLAYDLYWIGFTINSILLALSFF